MKLALQLIEALAVFVVIFDRAGDAMDARHVAELVARRASRAAGRADVQTFGRERCRSCQAMKGSGAGRQEHSHPDRCRFCCGWHCGGQMQTTASHSGQWRSARL